MCRMVVSFKKLMTCGAASYSSRIKDHERAFKFLPADRHLSWRRDCNWCSLLVAPFLVAYRQPDPEKLSAYECGFNAFDDARMKFDIRFYLVSILFIIFDLEVAFLFPWAVSFGQIGWFGFLSMMVFLGVLTIGFIYEWKKGALEWD